MLRCAPFLIFHEKTLTGFKSAVNIVWNFIQELDIFGCIPVQRKHEMNSLYFQGLTGPLHCSRGLSLVELTGDDNSAISTFVL